MNQDFWRDKRVLITGHTGFKGSWLSLWLQFMGVKLRGLALPPPTKPALFDVARVSEGMEHSITDIREFSAVQKQMYDFKPDIVIHMAAQPLVRLSYLLPIETYATNVMGTVHVLEAARQCGSVKAIVNITTDKCYENHEWVWGYRETEQMGGSDPYSSSKGCAELVSAAYRRSFLSSVGIAMATARAGNVIGGGDWALDRLVPDILRALEISSAIQIRNPNAIRPWQHVLDCLNGYLKLVRHQLLSDVSGEWNFGPDLSEKHSVEDLVIAFANSWGVEGKKWNLESTDQPFEAGYLLLDSSKARNELDWVDKLNFDNSVSWTASWYKNPKKVSARDLCTSQIETFMGVQQ